MNDAALKQASAAAKTAAENLKDVTQEVKERATDAAATAGKAAVDDIERAAKDVKQGAKDAGAAARQIDDVARAADLAATSPEDLDDIEKIERRMNARRESIRRHLHDARGSAERTARSWPIVATGAVIAAVAVGYVVAQRLRTSPTERAARSVWSKVREAPDRARRYVHEATKPPSRVWTERLAAGTGFAMAVARALPQLRAIAAMIPRSQRRRPAR